MNGIWIDRGRGVWSSSHGVYFYANGMYYSPAGIRNQALAEDYQNPEKYKDAFFRQLQFTNDYYDWGIFLVQADTIIGRQVAWRRSRLVAWQLYEERWLIRGDSLHRISAVYLPATIFQKPEKIRLEGTGYGFYKTAQKPDSSKAWFYAQP